MNYVILEPTGFMGNLINPETLKTMQEVGISIANGTLNISTLLIVVAVSYHMSANREYNNPIAKQC
ncbi:hypothetical protein MGH68_18105 [Erysipelothrix sp. D19-032]